MKFNVLDEGFSGISERQFAVYSKVAKETVKRLNLLHNFERRTSAFFLKPFLIREYIRRAKLF